MYKPVPIGIKPKYIHDEERCYELKMAIGIYLEANIKIPSEWIKEYNKLVNTIKERR